MNLFNAYRRAFLRKSVVAAAGMTAATFSGMALANEHADIAIGSPGNPEDKYPESVLYSKPVQVSEHVWSAIGATQPPTYENAGHNNNLSFVIGEDSVLVINGGRSWLLAEALDQEIQKITDKPVRYVVSENAQSHAMLGNSYWQDKGAVAIMHKLAAEQVRVAADDYVSSLENVIEEKARNTELRMPDITFDDHKMTLHLGGGVDAEILYLGVSHSHGDVSVYVPQDEVVIAGDIAFHERMLPIFTHNDTREWLETWEVFRELAEDKIIVPGHGGVTDFDTVDKYTRGYLEYLREKVGELVDAGGSLQDAYDIDQSPYAHLHTFDELARQNAGRVFQRMEFEF